MPRKKLRGILTIFSANFRVQYLENGLSELLEIRFAKGPDIGQCAHQISSNSDKPFSTSVVGGMWMMNWIGEILTSHFEDNKCFKLLLINITRPLQ